MWLLIAEALLALALLVGIVAWTMAGRRRGDAGAGHDEDAPPRRPPADRP
ncbi:MAG: hypothetical protein JNJ89_14585 [Rubrivivax sp.]|nr:hypothetical protein [Rubrivivax sp.]